MTIPTMPRVIYAQAWRRIDGTGDGAWHPLHPWPDDTPSVRRERPEPTPCDPRYEVRVVRYVLDEEGLA